MQMVEGHSSSQLNHGFHSYYSSSYHHSCIRLAANIVLVTAVIIDMAVVMMHVVAAFITVGIL